MNIVTSYSLGLFVTFSPAQFLAHGKSNGRKNRPVPLFVSSTKNRYIPLVAVILSQQTEKSGQFAVLGVFFGFQYGRKLAQLPKADK